MTVGRWQVGLAATLALAGVGLLFAEPTLLAAAAVPLVYVCYAVISGLSGAPQLRAARVFDPETASPGEEVTVRLRVENVGDSLLPDLRIVDGVPDLAVVDGSPRIATALAPGETATISYSVIARRGEHEFDDPLVRARSLSGSTVRTDRLGVDAGQTLTCLTPVRDRLSETVVRRAGQQSRGRGEGTEFHATREYRRGDPIRRIDWRHVAKTGEFVTIEYSDQQATRTAVIVDVRQPGRSRPTAGHPSAATLSVEAADRLVTALERAAVFAGLGVAGLEPGGSLATVGGVAWAGTASRRAAPAVLLSDVREMVATASSPDGSDTDRPTQAGPATAAAGADTDDGGSQRTTARPDGGPADLAAPDGSTPNPAHGSADSTGTAGEQSGGTVGSGESIEQLLGQLPPQAQVVLCSPVLDGWAVEFGRAAVARGHELVVVSPDVTRIDDAGTRLAGLRRRLRLRTLAELGAVVDWTPGRSVTIGSEGVR